VRQSRNTQDRMRWRTGAQDGRAGEYFPAKSRGQGHRAVRRTAHSEPNTFSSAVREQMPMAAASRNWNYRESKFWRAPSIDPHTVFWRAPIVADSHISPAKNRTPHVRGKPALWRRLRRSPRTRIRGRGRTTVPRRYLALITALLHHVASRGRTTWTGTSSTM